MPPPHVPVAARLESARRQRASLGFGAIMKGSRPSSAVAATRNLPIKATYDFPNEEDNLGYNGVVERCDSVDFHEINFDHLRKGAPIKNQPTIVKPMIVEMPLSPAISVQKSRVDKPRHKSMHETQLLGQLANSLSITPNAAAIHARPSGSGPAVGGPNIGPPLGPAMQGRSGQIESPPCAGNLHDDSDRMSKIPYLNTAKNSNLLQQGASYAVQGSTPNSLHDVLRAKESEVNHLNSLLLRQAEEKRRIQHIQHKLAVENLNLRGQVQELQTRQRPWSASSAGGRSWYDQQKQNNIHTIQVQHQPQLRSAQRPLRPTSAYQNNTHGQEMVRRQPVFGEESLLHRSVYTPTLDCDEMPSAATTAFNPQHRSPKDFLRPEAYRTLRGAVQRAGSASAGRLRPQSANAAVRQVATRQVSGASRPGSARPHSSYAERLIHSASDEFVRFHVAPSSEDETQRVINILAFMRGAAEKKYIRVTDFMAPFDKLKRGHISCTEFRRALESCACFGELSEEEYNLVFSFFLHESTASANVLIPTARICYTAFSEVLQPVGDKRVKLSVDQQVLKDLGQKNQHARDSVLATIELSKEGETKLQTLVMRIIEAIRFKRMTVPAFLEDLHPRSSNIKGSLVSPNINLVTGCMSRSQYLQGIRNSSLGIALSDDELALLFCKYDRNGEFNFFRFCRDIEAADKMKETKER